MGRKMKQQKLLHKTLRYYLGYGLLMTLFIISVFYLFIRQYHTHEIDEFLMIQREKIVKKSLRKLQVNEISTWNQFNIEENIMPDTEQMEDNIFKTEYIYSEQENEYEPHRVLYSRVEIEGEKFILTIRVNILESRKILQSSALLQLLLFIFLMVGMTIVTGLIYGKLWRPFYKTL
jgi:hypothetical protein